MPLSQGMYSVHYSYSSSNAYIPYNIIESPSMDGVSHSKIVEPAFVFCVYASQFTRRVF